MSAWDIVVIGGGIAGASAAWALAGKRRVVVLEGESRPGYHTTGRSAAVYIRTYGNTTIRALTLASGSFLFNPPEGFAEHPVLTPRGVLLIGRADQTAAIDEAFVEGRKQIESIRRLDGAACRALAPILRESYVGGGVHEPDAMDIDVDALHQGYLRGVRRQGGKVVCDALVRGIARAGGNWRLETTAGTFEAPMVVNAAGAWADTVAELAGVRPVGLVPKRRTAILFAPPEGAKSERWPVVTDVEEEFYFKPDAGNILASPADETPMEPCDVQPEELDVAICVDRIQKACDLEVRRIEHRWAGLRTFAPDKTLVCGFDPDADGFFWLAGQGGYGIQTSPAMARITAALVENDAIPADISEFGVTAAALSPARFRS